MQIAMFIYKYGMSLKDVLDLTIPQFQILNECLVKICKAESGEKEKAPDGSSGENMGQRRAMAETVKMLIAKTGRKKFTIDEVLNPAETIKKYGTK